MKLENAQASVKQYAAQLKEAAKQYAKGEISFDRLADIAKRHTNAVHALGRAMKAANEIIPSVPRGKK